MKRASEGTKSSWLAFAREPPPRENRRKFFRVRWLDSQAEPSAMNPFKTVGSYYFYKSFDSEILLSILWVDGTAVGGGVFPPAVGHRMQPKPFFGHLLFGYFWFQLMISRSVLVYSIIGSFI